jgi:hypothetical protein
MPFASKQAVQILRLASLGVLPQRRDEPPLSDEAWNLIQCCWMREASKRPAMKDIPERMMTIVNTIPSLLLSDGPHAIAVAEFGNFGKYGTRMRDRKAADDASEKPGNIVFPTEQERATLRRVPDSIPWSAYRKPLVLLPSMLSFFIELLAVIAFVELAERFSVCSSFLSP